MSIDTRTGFGGFGIDDTFPNITSQTSIRLIVHLPGTRNTFVKVYKERDHTHLVSSTLPVWGENSSIDTLTGFGKLSDLLNTQLTVVKPVIHDTYGSFVDGRTLSHSQVIEG